ncbi:hypothetical protein L1987_41114 [Smallanthus sonchifolius]|uniref:Uncharacterized protein n=1 Tax=Smallanthus sonchifolius TaxID=185202 RepID=A0ACB9GVD2_9ASTR|nr:hypothetical protein L1987_41114 [Smallanthus sonchifolius]
MNSKFPFATSFILSLPNNYRLLLIMAAGTSSKVPCTHVIGSTVVDLSRNSRTLVRISCKKIIKNELSVRSDKDRQPTSQVLVQGPSCIFVGPIENASQETLEAFYRQARDAYYSGEPLIVDDMFDRVELKLRWYGSKYVVKYPRCSLRQQSTYADAEEDPSQVFALASVWLLFLGIGSSACLVPVIYTFGQAFKDALDSGFSPASSHAPLLEFVAMLNGMLVMMLGSMIGYPVASLLVFAFVKSNQFNNSPHKAECHVCECLIEFRTEVEHSAARSGKRWVYGRIYLIRRRRMNRGQR